MTIICRATAVWSARKALALSTKLHRFCETNLDSKMDYAVHRDAVRTNIRFRNIHAGHRGFVVGNGPSLNRQNLQMLSGELTFAANSFWRHEIMNSWHPTYYFILDEAYFRSSTPFDSGLNDALNAATGSLFFCPAKLVSLLDSSVDHGRNRMFLVSFVGRLHDGELEWPNLERYIPKVWNVAQFALLTAIYMGCNPIYLIGCDHDFAATGWKLSYFHQGPTVAHLKEDGEPLSSVYEQCAHIWRGYEAIRVFSERHRIQIFNATEGGVLDVFERKRYDALFEASSTVA